MTHTVKEIAPRKVEAVVEIDEGIWKEAQERGFKKVASTISIPGFRPGKAPEAMLRGRVDQAKVWNEAIDSVLQTAYVELLNAEKLRPMERPDVEVTKLSPNELTIKFTIVLIPEVTLGTYKGLSAELKVAKVTEKEIEDAISARLAQSADLVLVDREAQKGDTVVIDFVGYVEGQDKPFDGGTAENYSLELGSNSFVPGFEDSLIGVKPGEKRDVKITFPTQYVAELAGKEALFKVTVHEVKEKSIPTLSDEAVKDFGIKDVNTIEELHEHEKKHLLEHKVADANREHYEALVKQIVDGATVTFAQETLQKEASAREEDLKKRVESNGLTFQQYLDVLGQKIEELRANILKETEESLKRYLVLEEIAIAEHLIVDDTELDLEISKLAGQYNMKTEDVKAQLGSQIENFRSNLQNRKIQEYILANNPGPKDEKAPKEEGAAQEESSVGDEKPKAKKSTGKKTSAKK